MAEHQTCVPESEGNINPIPKPIRFAENPAASTPFEEGKGPHPINL